MCNTDATTRTATVFKLRIVIGAKQDVSFYQTLSVLQKTIPVLNQKILFQILNKGTGIEEGWVEVLASFFFSVAGREINPEDLHISVLAEDENVGDFLNTAAVELDEYIIVWCQFLPSPAARQSP